MTAQDESSQEKKERSAPLYPFAPGAEGPKGRPDDTRPGSPPPPTPPGLRPVVLGGGRKKAAKEKKPGAEPSPAQDETKPGTSRPREERRNCSFPGLMKVIFPEQSFLPVPIAVRVANLSPRGAMVEIHDRARLNKDAVLVERFFELKVAHQQLPPVRGTIVWVDSSSTSPRAGLTFFEHSEEIAGLLSDLAATREATAEGSSMNSPPPLPMPTLDTFASVTTQTRQVVSGEAPEALEVRVHGEDKVFRAPVKDGRFEVEVELEPGGKNYFQLRSLAGKRRSKPLPVRIVCEGGAAGRKNRVETHREDRKGGGEQLRLSFQGTPADAERVLYRVSQLMAQSERLQLTASLETPGAFDEALVEALEAERDAIPGR